MGTLGDKYFAFCLCLGVSNRVMDLRKGGVKCINTGLVAKTAENSTFCLTCFLPAGVI